ncbi:hypothetical protein EKH80_04635 [Dyella choica]|uniref:DUF3187 family protein n=2 Tax=Dyella choica TaxID=1927959 RepID=A0A3S0Q5Y7_9GAMM|nr:hypothetical protein EKH80_04635 [Dyella choica]
MHRVVKARLTACLFAVLAMSGISTKAHADEPLLGFLYTTDLLPKHGQEVEQWVTWRHQKAGGQFDLLEGQTEYSYGATDSLQLSGYLIYDWTQAYRNGPDGTTTPPEPYSAYFPDPYRHFHSTKFIAGAFEAIWRVRSPYTDPVGVAFLFEPEIGPRFQELQVRAIFQKNFLDDRLVLVGNATWAPEVRELPGNPAAAPGSGTDRPNTNIETDVNFGIGASYRFTSNWAVGWEVQNEREINRFALFDHSQWMGNAVYAGPTIHYANQHFFATLTWWQQLPIAHNYMDPSVVARGYDNDVDFEHTRVRLKIGYYF